MKHLLFFIFAFLFACGPRMSYMRNHNVSQLSLYSNGDNVSDFYRLKKQGEELCAKEGYRDGISVVDARPDIQAKSNELDGKHTYMLMYQCKVKE